MFHNKTRDCFTLKQFPTTPRNEPTDYQYLYLLAHALNPMAQMNSIIMLRNYLFTALRNFRKHRLYSLINVIGLGLGIACCMAQFAIVQHEMSFDDFHEHPEHIYRVVEHYAGDNGMIYSAYLPNPLGHTLESELSNASAIPIQGPLNAKLKVSDGSGQKVFSEENNILFTNSKFLQHFHFPLVTGSASNYLDQPGYIYLSENIARKYFGTTEAVGRTIRYGEDIRLEVAGVLAEIPYNTNIHFEILVSYPTIRKIYPEWTANWGATWLGTTYLVLEDNTNPQAIEAQIAAITATHLSPEDQETTHYFLQPLADVHTNERYTNAPNYVPPRAALMGSIFTVALILLASILNFITLATSQSSARSKEVGIRKTLGGHKRNLIYQFLTETGILVIVASLIGLTLGQILLNLLNKAVSPFPFMVSYDPGILWFSLILILAVTLLAGFYPSMVLARLSPSQAIRNQTIWGGKRKKTYLRSGLIVVQFFVASLLLIVTTVSSNQMHYIHSKDLGFNDSNVLQIHFSDQTTKDLSVICRELGQLDFVDKTTQCMGPPQTGYSWNSSYNLTGHPSTDALHTNLKFVDKNYLDTYEIELIAGRNLDNKHFPDSSQQIMVNEEFVKRLNLSAHEAIGRKVDYNGQYRGTIIGVVKNFHLDKLTQTIRPVAMAYQPRQMNDIGIKLLKADLAHILPALEERFKTYDPEGVFEPKLLADEIRKSYIFENAMFSTFQVFTLLAIVIGLLGLYGLVNFMISKNLKSISIKKVFGAKTQQILISLSRQYLFLILIAFLLSTPVATWILQQWLSNFSYRIELSPWHFIVSLVLVVCISLLTVGAKSYQAANTNPADILRNE